MLPLHLTKFTGHGAGEYVSHCRERSQWFRDLDIDPRDWLSVSAILRASEHVHGIQPSHALAQAKVRAEQIRSSRGGG